MRKLVVIAALVACALLATAGVFIALGGNVRDLFERKPRSPGDDLEGGFV